MRKKKQKTKTQSILAHFFALNLSFLFFIWNAKDKIDNLYFVSNLYTGIYHDNT